MDGAVRPGSSQGWAEAQLPPGWLPVVGGLGGPCLHVEGPRQVPPTGCAPALIPGGEISGAGSPEPWRLLLGDVILTPRVGRQPRTPACLAPCPQAHYVLFCCIPGTHPPLAALCCATYAQDTPIVYRTHQDMPIAHRTQDTFIGHRTHQDRPAGSRSGRKGHQQG